MCYRKKLGTPESQDPEPGTAWKSWNHSSETRVLVYHLDSRAISLIVSTSTALSTLLEPCRSIVSWSDVLTVNNT
jgi:hypothetical protein